MGTKFSLLLPTKNRLDLLKHAVQSILNQTYQNYEIIISDNCSDDDVESYVDEIKDDRIIYLRHDKPISVTENWNAANDKATGDYIIMLGDDDALLPATLEELNNYIAQYNSPDVLNFSAYLYQQANVSKTCKESFIANMVKAYEYTASINEPEFLDINVRAKMVQSSLDFKYLFGFNMQYFCYNKKIVEKVKEYGLFYESPYPDYYTANALMLLAKSFLVIPKALVIIGITPKSYGYYYHNNIEKEGMIFHKEEDYRKKALPSVKRRLCNIAEMQTAAIATFALLEKRFPNLKLNFNAYYDAVIDRVLDTYEHLEAIKILKKEVLSKVGFLRYFKYKKKIKQIALRGPKPAVNIVNNNIKPNVNNISELIKFIEERTLK